MRTVRIMLAVAIALLITIPVAAQEKQKKKGKPAKISPISRAIMRMEKLRGALDGLDLTAEQEAKLGKIREEIGPKVKKVFGQLREILTEEQRNACEESAKKAKESGKKGRAFFETVESAIKLTDEQKKKTDKVAPQILALHREILKKVAGVLTPEQQKKLKANMRPAGKKERKDGDKKKKK